MEEMGSISPEKRPRGEGNPSKKQKTGGKGVGAVASKGGYGGGGGGQEEGGTSTDLQRMTTQIFALGRS